MKKFNISITKKHMGIGLLELMLSLAIIAVLLVMATRYYMSAAMNSRINQTIDAIMGLPAAAECWASSGSNTSNPGNYTGLNLYAVSYTDKCFPTSLVHNDASKTAALVTPYGDMTVSSTSTHVCILVNATPSTELSQIAGKLCRGSFTLGTGASFMYEAITQQCSAATTCS